MALTERKRWFRGSLRDKVVVVTGASAGVGRATALAFARKGATVVLVARGADGLENALAELRPMKVEALALPADVAEAGQLEAVADEVNATYGRIDVWVNCAMASVFSPFVQMTTAEFRRATEVTYLGMVWGTRAALKYMRPAGRGAIVQVGSALAHRGIPLQSAYCGAKHAMVGFTESLRTELIHEKSRVHVSMVHLPAMNTPQFDWVKSNLTHRAQPVPPIFQPEVAARAIVWAAAHKRRALWVGGSTIVAIVGNWLAPGIGDRYLARTGFGRSRPGSSSASGRTTCGRACPGSTARTDAWTSVPRRTARCCGCRSTSVRSPVRRCWVSPCSRCADVRDGQDCLRSAE